MTEPDKLDLRSHDMTADKRAELLRLFPEARTEGGKIDFERLKLALGEQVDVGRERYGLSWPGKAECFRAIQTPSVATLRPCREESVNFDTTENLIIEGDNLEVLKLLQKSYQAKVKLIYIDPPYNTGNDFIYPDNYSESLQTYLEYTGQVDAEGKRFGTNTEADGRFHSKWLNMMYPRLFLARNLLSEDGAIFISIDDGEVENLRRLCDDIFGEENFVVPIVWQKRITPENRRAFSFEHEYVLCYARSAASFLETRRLLPLTEEARGRYKNPDDDPRGDWLSVPAVAQAGHATKSQFYKLTTPDGRVLEPPPGRCWLYTEERMQREIGESRVWFGARGDGVPRIKRFLSDSRQGLTPSTMWSAEEVGANEDGKRRLSDLLSGVVVFDNPKPAGTIQRMQDIATQPDCQDIILDFFAGSGTTCDAVLTQNANDSGNRRFIAVQLPEATRMRRNDGTWEETPAWKAGYSTISEITKERVRRVIKKLDAEDSGKLDLNDGQKQDRGFRVFKLAESNFRPWDAQVVHEEAAVVDQLAFHVEHIRPNRSLDDLFYEILLKSGYALSSPVETLTLAGKQVHSVEGGTLLVCLELELTLELIRALAELKPSRIVCLDEGFKDNDQLKANAAKLFQSKGVAKFQTV
jgi:adenine-specific DNA-methyltransferase